MTFFKALRLRKSYSYGLLFFTLFSIHSIEAIDSDYEKIASPTVTTDFPSSIGANSVNLVGEVTSDGGNTVTERGIIYSLTNINANPQINGVGVIKNVYGSGTGFFGGFASGLKANTQYSFTAYAVNIDGTSYGTVRTFITTNSVPTFTSTPITAVGQGNNYNYLVFASDTELDPLIISAATKPSWLSFLDEFSVSLVAGSGTAGATDNTGSNASFNNPSQMAIDAVGNIYVADGANNKIRKITVAGTVITFAGSGVLGSTDGNGTSASFRNPTGIVIDRSGNLFVADFNNHKIRKITPSGDVTTFAGSGNPFSDDGNGTAASFSQPYKLAIDATDNLYLTDKSNNLIRKITPNGDVTTVAGTGSPGNAYGNGTSASFNQPSGIVLDASNNIFITDEGNNRIKKIATNGDVTGFAGSGVIGSTNGNGTAASFSSPNGITIDTDGNLYVADKNNHKIRKITPGKEVTTFGGSGVVGSANGLISGATFNYPRGILIDRAGNFYISSYSSEKVRKISKIKTLSGSTSGQTGVHTVVLSANDGNGGSVNQNFTISITLPPTVTTDNASSIASSSSVLGGNVTANGGSSITEKGILYAITSINANPTVNGTGVIKDKNGIGVSTFTETISNLKANTQYSYVAYATNGSAPYGYGTVKTFTTTNTAPTFTSTPITTAGQQTLYNYTFEYKDADVDPLTITTPTKPSWLTLSDEKLVSTLAGSGTAGSDEGSGVAASFNDPSQMAIDPAGNIYVADYNNHKIRKITPEGVVSTFAGTGSAGATDGIGTAASFSLPRGIVIDSYGNFYVASLGGNTIRKITPNGTVSTFAGSGTYGSADGNGTAASFSSPFNLTIDTSGNLYVTDFGSHNIRKITPNGDVTTIAGTGSAGAVNANGTSASFNQPVGIAVDASGNVYVSEFGNHNIRKIATNGNVTTFAGTGTNGVADGNGTSASFAAPGGITIDSNGNLYIAEFLHKVRKITPSGDVTTLIGNGVAGSVDGIISQATFNTPLGIIIDRSENLYVATIGDDKIRKITSVKKLSGTPTGQTGNHPVVINANDGNGGSVNQSFSIAIQLPPTVTTDDATSITPSTIVMGGNVTAAGNASVTERGIVYSVTSINANPKVDGVAVFKDDNGSGLSTFSETISNLFSNTQYSYAAYATNEHGTNYGVVKTFTTTNTSPTITSTAITTLNHGINYSYSITSNDSDGDPVTITATTKPNWLNISDEVFVSTLAGSFSTGSSDGNGTTASFNTPYGIAADNYGNVFIADTNNNKIRKVTPNGDVTTFAGSGTSGSADGNGIAASFSSPYGLEIDAFGNIYVADSNNRKIRKITPNGDVTTFAGSGTAGSTNGSGAAASFGFPVDVTIDINGNIYVADAAFHNVRKITPSGDVTTLAGSGTAGSTNATGTAASFNQPFGIAVDASSNIFVAEVANHNIRKITSAGVVTTYAGTGSTGSVDANGISASFNQPRGLTIDKLGNVYVTDITNRKVRKITPSRDVTTFAGSGTPGNTDGEGSEARFASLFDISMNRSGVFFAVDAIGVVRKINTSQKLSGDGSGQTGSYPIILQASDGKGGTSTQSYTIAYSINNFTANSGNWSTPGNWSQGRIPNTNENVEVLSGKTSVMDIADLVVGDFTNTGTTTIDKTNALTVNGKVTNTGTLTINSDASNSGVLIANGASSGNIIYKRGGLLDQKWSLVSPPVIGQKIRALAGNSINLIRINFTPPSYEKYAIATYNDANAANAKWEYYDSNTDVNLTFDMSKGYSMSRHNDGALTFTGTLQVDNLYNTVLADKWNAVGNPYTAYIPLNKNSNTSFLFDNLGRLSINAVYLWDNSQSKYVAASQLVSSDEKFIAPGQGFFVKTATGFTDLFFNKNRKSKKPSSGTHTFNRSSLTTPYIKLYAEKGSTKINTDIIYSATATKGFDTNEDIENFSTANFDVNTHLLEDSNGKDFTIQSIPQNDYENLIVPISLSAKTNDVVKFSASPSNLPNGLMVFLEDKNTNTFHNLDNNNSFTITLNEDSNGIGRFYLHTNSQSLSIDKENFLNNISIYQLNENTIKIEGLISQETIFKLYDILGKEVLRTNFNANNTKEISIKSLKKGIYFAEIKTDKGKTNKKILLK